jgi:RNA polymerase sigma factor (sigma-70 family)
MSPSVSARLLGTQSDARLVAFARAGHERAFEALVRRYRGPLLGYCRRLLLSEERAEDALQQALMQAWLALRAGTEVQNAKAWLYRVVHNSALNALRVSGYDYCTLNESLSDAPQEDLDRRIAVREALAGLAALPEMQREALLRTAVEGSSHREAARELGLSEPALRGLVYRARAALRATTGAFVPGPVVSWALGAGSGTSMGERVAEVGVGGGGAGVAGLLMKGGAMAVTAGVLAGGIAAVHAHPKQTGRKQTSVSAHRDRDLEAAHLALASAGSSSVRPVADSRRMSEAGRSLPAHGSVPKTKGVGERGRRGRVLAGIAPASAPMWPNRHGGGDRRDAANGGGVSHDGQRDSGAKGGGGTDATGGEGSGRNGGGLTLSGGGSGSGDGGGGSSGDAAKAGSTDGGQADGGGDPGGQSGQATDTSSGGEPSTGDHSSAGMTITNVSPTSEPSPSEGAKD